MASIPGGLGQEEFLAWQQRYRWDMRGFVEDTWGVTLDTWQCEAAEALSTGTIHRMAIVSGHGVGKTAFDAWAALWFLLTRFPVKVILTAPSQATLEDGLFAEIKGWIGKLPNALQLQLETTNDRVKLKAAPAEAFISVRTARADKPDALQGVHADYVLLIADEPSGIPDAIFEAAQGSLAGPARYMLMTGNPVYAQGYFYESITTNRDTVWWVRTVSCLEAARVPPSYIQEMGTLYGIESNVYRVRVLGLPPKGDDDTIIPLHLVQESFARDVQPVTTAPLLWGVDVARLGANYSCLAVRRGNTLLDVELFSGRNLMQLCGTIAARYQAASAEQKPDEILVDSIGMGAGVVDRLREMDLPVMGINVGEHEAINPMHWNLKSELWWAARAWFEARDCTIPTPALCAKADLVKALTVVRISHHSSGKLMVESKDSLKRRLAGRVQLDAADAFVLTFASRAATALYGARKFGSRRRGGALKRNLQGVV